MSQEKNGMLQIVLCEDQTDEVAGQCRKKRFEWNLKDFVVQLNWNETWMKRER